MRWPRRRRSSPGRAWPSGEGRAYPRGGVGASRQIGLALIGVLAAAAGTLFLLDTVLWPTLRVLAQAEVQNMATAAMYQAVRDASTDKLAGYEALFHVERGAGGLVTFMQPNAAAINDFAASATLGIQAQMKALDGRRVHVPLGRALGSRLLGGVGPRIPVTLYPVMLENVRVWDTFEGAGINQTRHRLYLNVKLTVRTAIPFIQSEVLVEGDFPIAEAIIVGKVPDVYFGGTWLPFFPRAGEMGEPESTGPEG